MAKKNTPSDFQSIENLYDLKITINEDKKEREERRQERREKRFEEKGDLKDLIQNLETLKSQIISDILDTDHWISKNPDSNLYKEYRKSFLDFLERLALIMGDAIYISNKEGRKIGEKDRETLLGFSDNYKEIKGEYRESSQKYSKESSEQIISSQKELKFKEISAKLVSASRYFKEAEEENIKLLDTLKAKESSDNFKPDEIRIDSTINKGAGSKKSPNEKVREVQKLILDKFKNNKDVTNTDVWKNFAKYEPDGIFGNATASIIPPIKAGLGMKDRSTDITQEFINNLSSIKESLLESSKVLGFFDFLKVNEDFDADAFKKEAEKIRTNINKTSSKKETQEEEKEKDYVIKIDNEKMEKIKGFVESLPSNPSTSFVTLKSPNDKGGKSLKIEVKSENEEEELITVATYYITPTGKIIMKDKDNKLYVGTLDDSLKNATFQKRGKFKVEEIINNPLSLSASSIERKLKESAFKIFLALSGTNKDEEMIYDEIKKLKTKEEYKELENLFGKLKATKEDLRMSRDGWKRTNTFDKMVERNKDKNAFLSLKEAIKKYLNSGEISRLNDHLPEGTDKI
jgi:hypothetical protein